VVLRCDERQHALGFEGQWLFGAVCRPSRTGREADSLETYARAFELPVRTAVKVEKLTKVGTRFEVSGRERTFCAENVVLATGAFAHPRVPSFARELTSTSFR
jgi:cation diffusion facilitator CzcD-associated flavoprotein CzcO